MKRGWAAIASFGLLAFSQNAAAFGVDDLGWLSGCWVQKTGDKVIEETWLSPSGGVVLGVGRTVKGGALRNYEFMRIEAVAGVPTFTAKPSGQAEASFPAKSQTSTEIVFENLKHDFPQRVIYRTTGKDGLEAAIEGMNGDKPVTIRFVYGRCL